MDILKSLATLVGRYVPSRRLPARLREDTLLGCLYHALSGSSPTTEAAEQVVFGGEYRSSLTYRLRQQLEEELTGAIFTISLPEREGNKFNESKVRGYRYYALGLNLQSLGSHKMAIHYYHKAAKIGDDLELVDLQMLIYRRLAVNQTMAQDASKELVAYRNSLKNAKRKFLAEATAEQYHLEASESYHTVKYEQYSALIQRIDGWLRELDNIDEGSKTHQFFHNYYMMALIRSMMLFDYEQSMKLCEEATERLNSAPNVRMAMLFQMNQVVCCIQLLKYREGKRLLDQLYTIYSMEGTVFWYRLMELEIKLCLHTEQYQSAHRLYQYAVKHTGYQKLRQVMKDQFLLYKGYLYLLWKVGFLPLDGERPFGRVTTAKLANEIEVLNKSSRHRVAFKLVQFLLLLVNGNQDAYIDRIELLNKYGYRKAIREATPRTGVVIKILYRVPDAGFSLPRLLPRVKRYRKELKDLRGKAQPHEIEILPYELVWDIIVKTLGPK